MMIMKITLSSVMVNDQNKTHKFYTNILGFVTKRDIAMGEFRWLTVVSPDDVDSTELALEPAADPASKIFQKAMFDYGKPLMAFVVKDIQQEFERLKKLGVKFTQEPVVMGEITRAVLEDTCGNYFQIYQVSS
jgi:predicted enzyme related to lactoylglutathione lyase